MELSGSLLLKNVCFYSQMYYYQFREYDGRPRYGRGWLKKCDQFHCKGEMRGLLNDSSDVSIDYNNVMSD